MSQYSARSRLPVIARLILGILLSTTLLPPANGKVPAGNDALSQFVKSYGCGKTKALLMQPVTKAMTVWADNVVGLAYGDVSYGDISKDAVYGIVQRGHVQQALSGIGDMINFVAVAEEAALGDPKKALRMASDWGIDYNVGMIAGPKGAAVWGVMKTLSSFAADLNKEILSLNMDTFANYVLEDPRLAGQNGGDIFLDEYAEWNSDEPHNAFWDNVRKQRGALIDYANITLNQQNFPRFTDWQKPKYRNQVRLAARLMMKDAAAIAEVVKKQNELKANIPGLKEELAILQKFQHWYALLKGVTCTDGLIDDRLGSCINGMTQAHQLLPEAEGFTLQRQLDGMSSVTEGLDRWDSVVDRLAGDLEVRIVETERLCREQQDSWEALSIQLNRFDRLEDQIHERSERIARQQTLICGTDDTRPDGQTLSAVEDDYADMLRMADEARSIQQRIARGQPPAVIDFTPYSRQLTGYQSQVESMKVEEAAADDEFNRASDIELKVDLMLRSCPSVDEFNRMVAGLSQEERYLADKHARLVSQLQRLQQNLKAYVDRNGPDLNDLQRRIKESQSFLQQRIERQTESRRCLDEIPDIAVLRDEGEARMERLQAPFLSANDAIAQIRRCQEAKKTAGTDEEEWGEGGYDTDSQFDGVIDQIHSAAQACDYHRAVSLADQVLAQAPDNPWVNQNYQQLQEWSVRNERYQRAMHTAIQHLQQGEVEAGLNTLNDAMQNASTHCGQDRDVIALREQAQRIADLEREEMIEQARRESVVDAREKARARERYHRRAAERQRTAESMESIMTGIVNALNRSSGRTATVPATRPAGNDDDIVDHLVKENERKYGDMMKKWQQSNSNSIRHPEPPSVRDTATGNDSWMRLPPDEYPGASPSGSNTRATSDGYRTGTGPLDGPLPPATGGYECSDPDGRCDEMHDGGW